MTIGEDLGNDRRAIKLWSLLGAVDKELLGSDPVELATRLTPETAPRVIDLGPRVARWLMAVAKATNAIKQPEQ